MEYVFLSCINFWEWMSDYDGFWALGVKTLQILILNILVFSPVLIYWWLLP